MNQPQPNKIPVTLDANGDMYTDQLGSLSELLTQGKPNWKLVRSGDGLTKHSVDILWIEWNEDGTFKEKHNDFAVGRSLLMSPFNQFFTWQCTSLTEILEQREGYLKFKTFNSTYELFKIN